MKQAIIIILMFWISFCVNGQDNYHIITEQSIANSYGLQNGEWVLFDDEVENFSNSFSYGSTDIIQLTTVNEDFTQITNILNEVEGGYFYDSGWGLENRNTVQQNDVCLLILNLRKTNNVNEFGKVTIGVQASDNTIFEESITIQLEEQWNRYLIPFQASTTYLPGELIIALGLAWEVQEIEVSGVNILNFNSNYSLDELPFVMHNERYGGYEADAPWRAEANNRIETNRKANLDILITDDNDAPLSGATVEVRMLEHEFKWGTAINLSRIAGNFQQDDEYENKLLNLDGEGHRFEWVVPENSFKWPGVEEGWIAPFDEKINAMKWLKENNYNIRHHALLWPSWVASPADIEENADNPDYIINRSNEWIDFILTHPDLENQFDEFDVINELTTNRDYENSFRGFGNYVTGREYYIEAVNLSNELAPNKPKVINDFVTISSQQYKGTEYDFLQNSIQEIIDGGADIDGIGFQAHINYFPTSIYEVESILNDFANKFDTDLKITEYDITDSRIDPILAANYLNDFLTMVFSIPQVDMFMFWEVWDGGHWANNGTLFNLDYSEKPAAQVLFNNLFDKWWTEEITETNSNGDVAIRAFKGAYEVKIIYEGNTIIDTVSLSEDLQLDYQINVTTATDDLDSNVETNIYPNPSNSLVNIKSSETVTSVRLYDMIGQLTFQKNGVSRNEIQLDIEDIPNGVYMLELNFNKKVTKQKIEILHK